MRQDARFAFSGGPGAGKTALLEVLRERGFHVVAESARAIIRENVAAGRDKRGEPADFAMAILERDRRAYAECPEGRVSLFDRSAVDALGMAVEAGALDEADAARVLDECRYHTCVFFLPPWRAIYHQDDERDQSFADAQHVYHSLMRAYLRCGYLPKVVPTLSLAARADFVAGEIRQLID